MDNNNPNNEQKVSVNASDLLKKFKTKEDRYNFLRENSKFKFFILDLYLPNEVGFDSNYFLQVLMGSKKLLPLGRHSDYNLKYFRKGNILTKDFLINIINEDPSYRQYIPDNISMKSLSRDYILSLIAYLSPNTYSMLYELYKKKTLEKETKKWNNFKVEIIQQFKANMDNFIPCQNNAINKKPFRLSKNGQITGMFIPNEIGPEEGNGNNNRINLKRNEKNTIKINLIRNNASNISGEYENEMDEDQKD